MDILIVVLLALVIFAIACRFLPELVAIGFLAIVVYNALPTVYTAPIEKAWTEFWKGVGEGRDHDGL